MNTLLYIILKHEYYLHKPSPLHKIKHTTYSIALQSNRCYISSQLTTTYILFFSLLTINCISLERRSSHRTLEFPSVLCSLIVIFQFWFYNFYVIVLVQTVSLSCFPQSKCWAYINQAITSNITEEKIMLQLVLMVCLLDV